MQDKVVHKFKYFIIFKIEPLKVYQIGFNSKATFCVHELNSKVLFHC